MSYSGRKLALAPERDGELAVIRRASSAKSDSAAMNEAIRCWARLARPDLDLSKIELALWLYDQLKKELQEGVELCTEKPGDPDYRRKSFKFPI